MIYLSEEWKNDWKPDNAELEDDSEAEGPRGKRDNESQSQPSLPPGSEPQALPAPSDGPFNGGSGSGGSPLPGLPDPDGDSQTPPAPGDDDGGYDDSWFPPDPGSPESASAPREYPRRSPGQLAPKFDQLALAPVWVTCRKAEGPDGNGYREFNYKIWFHNIGRNQVIHCSFLVGSSFYIGKGRSRRRVPESEASTHAIRAGYDAAKRVQSLLRGGLPPIRDIVCSRMRTIMRDILNKRYPKRYSVREGTVPCQF